MSLRRGLAGEIGPGIERPRDLQRGERCHQGGIEAEADARQAGIPIRAFPYLVVPSNLYVFTVHYLHIVVPTPN